MNPLKDPRNQVLEYLKPSSAEVYKIERDKEIQILKIADSRINRKNAINMMIANSIEYQLLKKLEGTEGLPKAYEIQGIDLNFFSRTIVSTIGTVFPFRCWLRKEFIQGKTMSELGLTHLHDGIGTLANIVERLHAEGLANIDLNDVNIVINPEGKPYLIDFVKKPIIYKHPEFDKYRKRDLEIISQGIGIKTAN